MLGKFIRWWVSNFIEFLLCHYYINTCDKIADWKKLHLPQTDVIRLRNEKIRKFESFLTLTESLQSFHTSLSLFLFFIAKDENIRRMINEIENLTEDSNKLQQILDLVSTLRCPHQSLEESIRDLQLNIQRQLLERQSNDSQLNVLELNVNEP